MFNETGHLVDFERTVKQTNQGVEYASEGEEIMGTNYYAVRKKPSLYNREIHLGKSSIGWLFLFQEQDDIHTFPQFCKWLENNVDTGEWVLFNEYNEEVSKEYLLNVIESTQKNPRCRDNPDNFKYGCKNVDGYRFDMRDFS